MLVFSNTPGVTAAVYTGQSIPFSIAIGGNPGVLAFQGAPIMKAVLTNFDVENRSGLGVQHTLRDRIYIYVFGERAGRATVTGMAFAGYCGNFLNYTGFDAVYSYYEWTRASQQGLAVQLIFGPQTVLYGYMERFRFRLEDPATAVGTFAFDFVTLPRNATLQTSPPVPWSTLAPPFLSAGFGGGAQSTFGGGTDSGLVSITDIGTGLTTTGPNPLLGPPLPPPIYTALP